MNYFYPGRGLALQTAAGATGNQPNAAANGAIPTDGYSVGIGAGDCLELTFAVDFAGDVTNGNVEIERSSTSDFANSSIVATVTTASGRAATYNVGTGGGGFYRVRNRAAQPATVYIQKRLN